MQLPPHPSHPASTGALIIAPQAGHPAPFAYTTIAAIALVPGHIWERVAGMLAPRDRANLARVSKTILQAVQVMLHSDKVGHAARLAVTPSIIAAVLRSCSSAPAPALPQQHRDKRQCVALARPDIPVARRAEILTTLVQTVFGLPYTTSRQRDVVKAVLDLPASVRGKPLQQMLTVVGARTRGRADSVRAVIEACGVSPDDLIIAVLGLPVNQRGPALCAYLGLSSQPMSGEALALWIDYARPLALDQRVAVLTALHARVAWCHGMPAHVDRHLQLLEANGELVDAMQRPLSVQKTLLLALVKELVSCRSTPFFGPEFHSAPWPTLLDAVLASTNALPIQDRGIVIQALAAAADGSAPAGTADRIRVAAKDLLPADREAVAAVFRFFEGAGPLVIPSPPALSEFFNFLKTTKDEAVILERYARLPQEIQLAVQRGVIAKAYKRDEKRVQWAPLAGAMLARTTNARMNAGSLGPELIDAWDAMMCQTRESSKAKRDWLKVTAWALSRIPPLPRAEVLNVLAAKFTQMDERQWILAQTLKLPLIIQAPILCRLAMFDLDKWDVQQLAAKPLLAQLIAATAALPGQYQGLPLVALQELRAQRRRHPALQDLWQRFGAMRWAAPPEDIRFD